MFLYYTYRKKTFVFYVDRNRQIQYRRMPERLAITAIFGTMSRFLDGSREGDAFSTLQTFFTWGAQTLLIWTQRVSIGICSHHAWKLLVTIIIFLN